MPVGEDEIGVGLRNALELENQIHEFVLASAVGVHRTTVYRVHHGRAVGEIEGDVIVKIPTRPAGYTLTAPAILNMLVGDAYPLCGALVFATEPL